MSTTIEKDLKDWADNVIGAPYVTGGRGPDVFDCWGLVVDFFDKLHSVDLPHYPNEDPANTRRVAGHMTEGLKNGEWVKIEEPESGCLVAMSRSKVVHHVGVWLDISGGVCLHAFDGLQVMAHTLQQLKNQNFSIIEFYRWSDL